MTKEGFLDKVAEIHFRDNCDTPEAIKRARKECEITDKEFEDLFGRGENAKEMAER